MITAIGLGTDPTMRHFLSIAARLGERVQFIDLLDVVSAPWEVRLSPGETSFVSALPPFRGQSDGDGSYYCRLIDLGGVDPTRRDIWGAMIAAVSAWLELYDGTVVNRPGHVNDNACKPLHETQLARLGFSVPPSFTGSARDELIAFTVAGKTVAKAASGQRADSRTVTEADFTDYREESGPVHLQRFVEGEDVRAHVIGNEVIAVRIRSGAADYRLDRDAHFDPCTLPEDLNGRFRRATAEFGLAFAGWDLRVGPSDIWVLEANPMPGYSFYDTRLEGRLTQALLRHLRARHGPGQAS